MTVTLHGKRDCEDVIKVADLGWEIILDYLVAQSSYMSPSKWKQKAKGE